MKNRKNSQKHSPKTLKDTTGVESDSEQEKNPLPLKAEKKPAPKEKPRQMVVASAVVSGEGDWQVVQRQRSERKSFDREISRFPLQITVGEQSVQVILSDTYQAHIAQRHEEVGGHDLTEEEVFEVLQNPSAILKNHDPKTQLRYVFLGAVADGKFARVIISKWPGERHFNLVTSYRSQRLPRSFSEIDEDTTP